MPLNRETRHDYWGCKEPKCPHCDHDLNIVRHELYALYEEGDHAVSCPYCECDFRVSVHVSHSYDTSEQPEDSAVSAGEKP